MNDDHAHGNVHVYYALYLIECPYGLRDEFFGSCGAACVGSREGEEGEGYLAQGPGLCAGLWWDGDCWRSGRRGEGGGG